jgi:CRP/FNR family cyclic AMP-dependent transcriptional regulator
MDLLSYFKTKLDPIAYSNLIKEIDYKKGDYIYMPPNKPSEMFQVYSGVIKIGSYTEEGHEVCYDLLFKKEVFGNLRYLNGQFFEFAKALTDCKVISYDLAFYKKMIVHDPEMSDWFNQTTIQRWCRMETRLFKICTLSPIDRIKSLYKEFDEIIEDSKKQQVHVPDLLHIVDISQMTGITRQTVSKLMKSVFETKNKSNTKIIDRSSLKI